jgi:uncharacterized membrane protein YgdD (TMEM256/DUF423 family)
MIPRRFLARIAPWWVLLVLIGSFLPGPGKKALGTLNSVKSHKGGDASSNHRFAHFLVFGSTALLFLMLAETRGQQIRAAVGVALFGLVIECGQYEILRLDQLEWWDIRDDALASAVALLLDRTMNIRGRLLSQDIG